MTWDDDEPDIPDMRYTLKVTMEVEVEVIAPKGASDNQLAQLAQEQIESDPYVNEAVASDLEIISAEVQ